MCCYVAGTGQAIRSATSFSDSPTTRMRNSGSLLAISQQASAGHCQEPEQSSIQAAKAPSWPHIQGKEELQPGQQQLQPDYVKAYVPQVASGQVTPYTPHLGRVSPLHAGWGSLQPENVEQSFQKSILSQANRTLHEQSSLGSSAKPVHVIAAPPESQAGNDCYRAVSH